MLGQKKIWSTKIGQIFFLVNKIWVENFLGEKKLGRKKCWVKKKFGQHRVGVGWITDQKHCHSNLIGVGLSWAATTNGTVQKQNGPGGGSDYLRWAARVCFHTQRTLVPKQVWPRKKCGPKKLFVLKGGHKIPIFCNVLARWNLGFVPKISCLVILEEALNVWLG